MTRATSWLRRVFRGLLPRGAGPAGGNITGLGVPTSEMVGKRLQLLREVAPTVTRIAVLLKTAKALGLTIPPSVLGRADEVIQ